jgi:Arc/MetJ-type ribon-helix-helix transcriptional regulator
MSEPVQDPQESSAMRELRNHARELERSLKAAKEAAEQAAAEREEVSQRLTAIEREKMGDLERSAAELKDKDKRINDLSAQVAELLPVRETLESYNGAFESILSQRLQSVPEQHRESVAKLVGNGDYPQRLEALETAISLIPAQEPARPTQPGVQPPLNPGVGQNAKGQRQPLPLAEIAKNPSAGWSAAFPTRPTPPGQQPTE